MFARTVDWIVPQSARGAFYRGFGLSLVLGLSIVLVIGPLTGLGQHFGGTCHDGYLELASNIARGHGYVFEPGGPPVMHRPPLIPVSLAPVTLLPFAWQRPMLVVLHSLMVGTTCFLLFDLALRSLGARVARSSVVLLLFYPWLFWHVKNPMNVVGQMLCVSTTVYLIGRVFLHAEEKDNSEYSTNWYLGSVILGLALAAGILTHGTMLLSMPLLLLMTAIVGLLRARYRTVLVAVAAGSVALMTVAPWTYRNWKVTRQFVPVVSNAGIAYFWGNAHWRLDDKNTQGNEVERALAMAGIYEKPSEILHFWGAKDFRAEKRINQRMREHMTSHPGQLAKKVSLNAVEFFFPVCHDALGPDPLRREGGMIRRLVVSGWHFVLWSLALVGLWRRRRSPSRSCLLAVLACIVVLSLPYLPLLVNVGHSQYVLPTIPLLVVLSANGIVSLSDRKKGPNQSAFHARNIRTRSWRSLVAR